MLKSRKQTTEKGAEESKYNPENKGVIISTPIIEFVKEITLLIFTLRIFKRHNPFTYG